MKLIVPMAGRGTRVRPHSHVTPKPLLTVRGRSIVERIVDTFSQVLPAPPDDGVFVLGPDFGNEIRDQLTALCDERGITPHFPVQEEALGTAHAVGCADEHLQGEGVVVFADTLFGLSDEVTLGDADVMAFVREVDDPSRFGVAVRDGEQVTELIEKPDDPISNEALIGIYYLRELAQLKDGIDHVIDSDLKGADGEYQLTDALDYRLQQGDVFTAAGVDAWMDCGTIPALLETTGRVLERESGDLHEGTVEDSVVHDPVYIGPDATVKNAVVGPHVSIEAGATVSNSVVRDSIVFAGGEVENAVLADSVIGRDAAVDQRVRSLNVGDHSQINVELRS
ncbi:sugar phosphate nucleotidyltransferase [Salinibacter altiplanensis]|uniref:sugar phosphate nucleotidyltransferase n=1 Tax=Salinibacter altiplanensis TaxID=1803181 RepID=UPI000C9F5087|nr:sugar phosphate nucleotidyltransferase [Salinibacter altiplanensis]